MKVFRDFTYDNQSTTTDQIIPIYHLKGEDLNLPPGSILFDQQTNNFYGSDNNYALVPLSTRNVTTINTGITPAGSAITSDGKFLYVANNNNYGIQDSVTVIDLSTNLPIKTIVDASFNQAYTITINSSNTKAYVTNSAGSTVSIIDISSNTVVGIISGFDGPSGMVINGNVGYVNNYGAGVNSGNGTTVRTVDLVNNVIIGSPIIVGQAPAALAISSDGKFVYCINYVTGVANNGTMSIIQTSTNTVVNTVVNTVSGLFGPFGITLSSHFAYVSNFGSNNFDPFGSTVSVIDLNSNTIVHTINVGIQPSGIVASLDGRYIYVCNYNTLYAGVDFTNLTAGQGTVNIIDTSTYMLIPPTITVGQSPGNITINPNGKYMYVSNFTSNTISVIST